jgi:hypothetical protein
VTDQLEQHLRQTETTLRTKPNYRRGWHRLAAWVASLLLSLVGRDFDAYWTTLGDTIYAPAGHVVDLEDPRDYAVVCHELAHRYDDRAHGWRYRLSYLLSWAARARWEYRGYGMALVAYYRQTGQIPDELPQRYAEELAGPAYLWAADHEEALEVFQSIADALRTGALAPTVFDPNDPVFEEYIPE